jgi:hypothetical protein
MQAGGGGQVCCGGGGRAPSSPDRPRGGGEGSASCSALPTAPLPPPRRLAGPVLGLGPGVPSSSPSSAAPSSRNRCCRGRLRATRAERGPRGVPLAPISTSPALPSALLPPTAASSTPGSSSALSLPAWEASSSSSGSDGRPRVLRTGLLGAGGSGGLPPPLMRRVPACISCRPGPAPTPGSREQ